MTATTTTSRSTQEVLDDHLHESQHGSLDADLERNDDPGLVVLCANGVFRGHDGLRQLAERLRTELPDATFTYRTVVAADDIGFLEREAISPTGTVRDGADSYVVCDGRIVAQTIHHTIQPR